MCNAFTRSKLFVHVLKLTHKSNIKILFIVFNQLGSLTYLKGKSIVICNTPTPFSTLYIIIIIIIIIIMLSISLIIIINILPLSSYYYIRIIHIYSIIIISNINVIINIIIIIIIISRKKHAWRRPHVFSHNIQFH